MVDDIDFDQKIDDNFNGVFDITCPQCKAHIKKKLQSLGQGTEISCSCGAR